MCPRQFWKVDLKVLHFQVDFLQKIIDLRYSSYMYYVDDDDDECYYLQAIPGELFGSTVSTSLNQFDVCRSCYSFIIACFSFFKNFFRKIQLSPMTTPLLFNAFHHDRYYNVQLHLDAQWSTNLLTAFVTTLSKTKNMFNSANMAISFDGDDNYDEPITSAKVKHLFLWQILLVHLPHSLLLPILLLLPKNPMPFKLMMAMMLRKKLGE
jgi:hypothetical protein